MNQLHVGLFNDFNKVLNVILFYLIYIPVNPFFLDFVFGYLGGIFFLIYKNGKMKHIIFYISKVISFF